MAWLQNHFGLVSVHGHLGVGDPRSTPLPENIPSTPSCLRKAPLPPGQTPSPRTNHRRVRSHHLGLWTTGLPRLLQNTHGVINTLNHHKMPACEWGRGPRRAEVSFCARFSKHRNFSAANSASVIISHVPFLFRWSNSARPEGKRGAVRPRTAGPRFLLMLSRWRPSQAAPSQEPAESSPRLQPAACKAPALLRAALLAG